MTTLSYTELDHRQLIKLLRLLRPLLHTRQANVRIGDDTPGRLALRMGIVGSSDHPIWCVTTDTGQVLAHYDASSAGYTSFAFAYPQLFVLDAPWGSADTRHSVYDFSA